MNRTKFGLKYILKEKDNGIEDGNKDGIKGLKGRKSQKLIVHLVFCFVFSRILKKSTREGLINEKNRCELLIMIFFLFYNNNKFN